MDHNRKNLILTISCLILTIIIAISVSYAWFHDYVTDKAAINQISVSSGDAIFVSADGGVNFTNNFVLDYSSVVMTDVTGDGVTFISPIRALKTDVEEHGVDYDSIFSAIIPEQVASAAISTKTTLSSGEYISTDLTFRSNKRMDIYLADSSSVNPSSENLTGTTIDNQSEYGDFSKNGIAGAARVSFVDSTNQLRMYWIPNSTYELSFGPVVDPLTTESVNKWSFQTNGTPEDSTTIPVAERGYYYYKNGTSGLEKVAVTDYVKQLPAVNKTVAKAPNDAISLVTLSETVADSGIYEGTITVNIWVEGCDREARRALAGGFFNVKLIFIGFEHEGV